MVLARVVLIIKIFLLLHLLLLFNGGTVIRTQTSLSAQFTFIKGVVGSFGCLSSAPANYPGIPLPGNNENSNNSTIYSVGTPPQVLC